MATIMLMLINFIKNKQPLLKFISINIVAAICCPPPLISQIFSSGYIFSQLGCFYVDITSILIVSFKTIRLDTLFQLFSLYYRNCRRPCGYMHLRRTEIR